MYIGQTERSFDVRISKHKKAIDIKEYSLGFRQHCTDNTHKISENAKISYVYNKGKVKNVLMKKC